MIISICIPAYKNTDYLKRLLDSIMFQDFLDFEVIVTDDSPDSEIKNLCFTYAEKLNLRYYRNSHAFGTPENWNEAIRKAKGEWIKLMHDDDWFAESGSLSIFYEAIKKNPGASFIFCAYRNIYLEKKSEEKICISSFRFEQLCKNPATLFSSNVIGPPSVILHRNDKKYFYDKKLRWLVDIDFYIRYLKESRPVYINKPLIHVGIGKEQVTRDCFRQRLIEIPESFYLLNKTGIKTLRNILIYDAWWRLMRNLEIKRKEDITESGYTGRIPLAIWSMIRWQRNIPFFILKTGVLSKSLMLLNYLFNFSKIDK
jgi:glycosyltransferase involved in cell wall biosynthesis